MTKLEDQIEVYGRLQYVLGLLIVLSLLGFYFFVYRPSDKHLIGLGNEIDQRRFELAAASTEAGKLPKVRAEVDRIASRVDHLAPMAHVSELAAMNSDLMLLGRSEQVDGFKYEPRPERQAGTYGEYPVRLTFESNFPEAVQFIRRVESLPRMLRVRSLSIQSIDSSSSGNRTARTRQQVAQEAGRVKVDMVIHLYFREG
ncbi:MAG: type 4a pilus biogenesis protein PilO [Phycisphaerae bacterium]